MGARAWPSASACAKPERLSRRRRGPLVEADGQVLQLRAMMIPVIEPHAMHDDGELVGDGNASLLRVGTFAELEPLANKGRFFLFR